MNTLSLLKSGAAAGLACAVAGAFAADALADSTTPIKHVIVVVGENDTFDNIFGTYRPRHGQTIQNLWSQGIVDENGQPGPNFSRAAQMTATENGTYSIDPHRTGPYAKLPVPNTTYATGQPQGIVDKRFPAHLNNGPFQISKYAPYDAFVGDPVHRFFQMWQQIGTGRHDLFVWVAETAGTGNHTAGDFVDDTVQGALAMGFYNMQAGDAPFFQEMARHYVIGDNYHQAIMGGTGANFLALVTGDAAFYNSNGSAATPPTSVTALGTNVSQIENPNPQSVAGNPNWYTEDGYSGGSYVNCADAAQPGVAAIANYLATLHVPPKCAPGHYYLVNNYGLGYKPDGTPVDRTASPFTLPPQPATLPTIADALAAKGVSWKYYSGGRGDGSKPTSEYCGICDPLIAFTSVMTDASKRANLQDISALYTDIQEDTLPEVVYVRPLETMAGHPANSLVSNYENFVTDLVNIVHRKHKLWQSTAIILTEDEGGGYYDSGYVQPVDFFGDGTRIPLVIVSPYAKEGFVDHTYYDHASILKFIERNWGLNPLSSRSRDNLPNPVQAPGGYKPHNTPAIGDLMSAFDFNQFRHNAPLIGVPDDDEGDHHHRRHHDDD
ncbi:MAG: alkaline phosphatase family protein [Betaproteobacteria bacterium]